MSSAARQTSSMADPVVIWGAVLMAKRMAATIPQAQQPGAPPFPGPVGLSTAGWTKCPPPSPGTQVLNGGMVGGCQVTVFDAVTWRSGWVTVNVTSATLPGPKLVSVVVKLLMSVSRA